MMKIKKLFRRLVDFFVKYKAQTIAVIGAAILITTGFLLYNANFNFDSDADIQAIDNAPVSLEADSDKDLNVGDDASEYVGIQTKEIPKGTHVEVSDDGTAKLLCSGDHVFEYFDCEDGIHHLARCKKCDFEEMQLHRTIGKAGNVGKLVCLDCGAILDCQHEFQYESIDEYYHKVVCKKCKIEVKEAHQYSDTEYQNGIWVNTCKFCNHKATMDGKVTCSISCHGIIDYATDGLKEAIPNNGYLLTSCEIEIREGDTVYDVLRRVLNAKGVSYNAGSTGYGTYVSMIDNLSDSKIGHTAGWCYYVNGSLPMVSCDNTVVNPGDSISWEYDDDWTF